jgi:hypothetical protein
VTLPPMEHRFAAVADLDRLAHWNRQLIEDERAENPLAVRFADHALALVRR